MTSHQEVWRRMTWPVIGVLMVIAAVAAIIAVDYNNQQGWVVDLFQRWQTLISGFLALVAAAFTAQFIALQIASAESMERKRFDEAAEEKRLFQERSHMAARSVLPLTLNILGDYSKGIALAVQDVLAQTPEFVIEAERLSHMPQLPKTPLDVTSDLQEFIRTAPLEVGGQVTDLLSDLQLLSANAEGTWQMLFFPNETTLVFRDTLEAIVGRAAVLHARINQLYPYARREKDSAELPSLNNIERSLRMWRVDAEKHPGYLRPAETYLRRSTTPVP